MSNKNSNQQQSIRGKALDWFFPLDEVQKDNLKEKYFTNEYIEYSSQWGYHFTFGQIETMYLAEYPEANQN